LKNRPLDPRPRIAKIIEMRDMGEVGANNYSPLQRFPGGGRGEPCVHPEFSDGLLELHFNIKPVFFKIPVLIKMQVTFL
jgi:hypothetical protein